MEAIEKLKQAIEVVDPLQKQMEIAAIISAELEKAGTKTVLVGGSAVEFYTMGSYHTADIDLVATTADNIKSVMTGLGFTNEGGTWILPNNRDVVVEFPAGPLEGDWHRVNLIKMPNEQTIRVIGVEDIIIDRACVAKGWANDEWAKAIMITKHDQIDWAYLDKQADYQGVKDIIDKFRVEADKELRIIAIRDYASPAGQLKTAENEYMSRASKLYKEAGQWPGIEADKKIATELLKSGRSIQGVTDKIMARSPEAVGNDKAQIVLKIQQMVNKLAKSPEIKKDRTKGIER